MTAIGDFRPLSRLTDALRQLGNFSQANRALGELVHPRGFEPLTFAFGVNLRVLC